MGSAGNRADSVRVVGRYALHAELAAGGMSTVHIGRMTAPGGFRRTVAIKRLLPSISREPEFVARFLDEARMAARIQHHNVVSTLDVVRSEGELFLVMEYVQGETLAGLLELAPSRKLPVDIACAIGGCMLAGLHAAHEARDEEGKPLAIVHRDISPQNVIVGVDGVARLLDFGIATAAGRCHITTDGAIRGKLQYMAPELLSGSAASRATDIYAASIVMWECLTGKRYLSGATDAALIASILMPPQKGLRSVAPEVPEAVDAVVRRGLSVDPSDRFADAREMALALANASRSAPAPRVGAFVERLAKASLERRARIVASVDGGRPLEERTPRNVTVALSPRLLKTQQLPWSTPQGCALSRTEGGALRARDGARPTRRLRGVGLVLAGAALALGLVGALRAGLTRQKAQATSATEPPPRASKPTAPISSAPPSDRSSPPAEPDAGLPPSPPPAHPATTLSRKKTRAKTVP